MIMVDRIVAVHAHEILDSRGNPTLSTTVILKSGARGVAAVPSGASTGSHEAHELRDGDQKRYRGLGVLKAVKNTNSSLALVTIGLDPFKQRELDDQLRIADGTPHKSKLGANAILGISLAAAVAAAKSAGIPLYRHLRQIFAPTLRGYKLPTPLLNVFNGGRHADTNLDIQEFLVIPHNFSTFAKRLQVGTEIYHTLGEILHADGLDTDVGNEGGYAPRIGASEKVLEYLVKAIKKSGYSPKSVGIGLDVAASEFYDERQEKYLMTTDRRRYTAPQMIELFISWQKKYPLISIEDGLSEDAWSDWQSLTRRLGGDLMLVGDDLFVTQADRLQRGIELGVGNAVLIKPNQVGTLSETMDTILMAQANRYKVIISHRSGETTDTFIADLAVAINAQYIKSGAPARSERLCKYNRLLEIEEEL